MPSSSSFAATALRILSLAGTGSAFWRMVCPGRLVDERLDPIISPGQVSGHVHTIAGGNGFTDLMTYATTQTSNCSSCPITQDMSNYWTPKLFYQYEDGTFEMVPQAGDGPGVLGGMNVYYLQRGGPNNDPLVAFPEGFRMTAGNPFLRSYNDDFAGQAISFVCLDYSGTSNYYNGLPNTTCPDGLRAQVFFPSCWNGVDLSSPTNSHVSYPESVAYNNGPCPSDYPVHLVSLFYEVIYSTAGYEWWNGTQQPFVFAMGDPTGYGFHGDFINGWNVSTLQTAINECTNDSGLVSDCPVFETFSDDECEACVLAPIVDENIDGVLDTLPGCNPVVWGPGNAPYTDPGCTSNATLYSGSAYYNNVTGFEYIGCGADNNPNRTFTGASWFSNNMTVEGCLHYCQSKGFQYSGLEYASQCFCGNSLPAASAPVPGILGNCFTPCAGNSSEYCGGANRLSIYYAETVASTISCPSGNATQWTTPNNATFWVDCAGDYAGYDLTMNYTTNGIQGCIEACSTTAGCKAVSLSGTACYMKSAVGTLGYSTGVQAAKLMSGGTPGTSTTSTSSATSTGTTSATDAAGSVYSIYFSSDSSQGAYNNVAASNSYKDCMTACDAATKCTAFTYVGGANGIGSGTCWLKTTLGSLVPKTSNTYLSGVRNSSSSASSALSSATATTTTTSSATNLPSTTAAVCPASNQTVYTDQATNATFLIECGIDHTAGDLSMVYVNNLAGCISACANTTGCVDVSLSGTACYMKKTLGAALVDAGVNGAKLLTNGTVSSTATSATSTTAAAVNVVKGFRQTTSTPSAQSTKTTTSTPVSSPTSIKTAASTPTTSPISSTTTSTALSSPTSPTTTKKTTSSTSTGYTTITTTVSSTATTLTLALSTETTTTAASTETFTLGLLSTKTTTSGSTTKTTTLWSTLNTSTSTSTTSSPSSATTATSTAKTTSTKK